MPRKTVPIMKLNKADREKLRELRKAKEQRYDEITNKVCLRVPKDLYLAQKRVAKELGITYTQLIISLMLSVPIPNIKDIKKIVFDSNVKRDNLLNSSNPEEGIKFDVNSNKWVLAVKYNSNKDKVSVKPTKYDKYAEAKIAWVKRLAKINLDSGVSMDTDEDIGNHIDMELDTQSQEYEIEID